MKNRTEREGGGETDRDHHSFDMPLGFVFRLNWNEAMSASHILPFTPDSSTLNVEISRKFVCVRVSVCVCVCVVNFCF